MNISLPTYAVFFGAAAFALRLAQNRTGFEAGTALPIPGNLPAAALPVLLAAAAVSLMVWSAKRLPPASRWQADFSAPSRLGRGLVWAGSLLLLGGGGWKLAQAAAARSVVTARGLQTAISPGEVIMGAGAVGAAACLLILALPAGLQRGRTALALLPVPVLLLARLVFVYRACSVDPVLAHYCHRLLAEMALILGFYRLSGFTVGCGRPRYLGVYAGMALILTLTVLADGISPAALVCGGGVAALWGLCLMVRLSPPQETAEQIRPQA